LKLFVHNNRINLPSATEFNQFIRNSNTQKLLCI